jgi:hypothetical protein
VFGRSSVELIGREAFGAGQLPEPRPRND